MQDCPLVTLAMVIDSAGFPKRSEVFEGNVSEPATLEKMIQSLAGDKERPMVVTDAGIGTQDNLDRLVASGYDYLTVSRKRKRDMPDIQSMAIVRENDQRLIRAALRINETGEMQVYCHSSAKEIKERGIKTRFEKRFEEQLQKVQNGLCRKHRTKKYEKVLEKIGRLKEKYRRAANRYDIHVEKDDKTGNALKINWLKKEIDDTSGYYVLRTNRTDLDEKQVFDTFTMLLDLEDAFRSMKSDLGLRPVHHQIEFRCDGHLFITVIGYHVLQTIRVKLRSKAITHSWRTIRDLLSTHYRVTTSMKRSDGKMIYIRKCSKPEECHIKIYNALNLSHRPGIIRKTVI
jgi:transposase